MFGIQSILSKKTVTKFRLLLKICNTFILFLFSPTIMTIKGGIMIKDYYQEKNIPEEIREETSMRFEDDDMEEITPEAEE